MNRARHGARGFATDGQIASRQSSGPGRELQKFDDNSASMPTTAPKALSEHLGGKDAETFGDLCTAGKWDQFRDNPEKFGVSTLFDESQYTTTINRSRPDHAKHEREAERIAAEIEGKVSTNIHMQEERNQLGLTDMYEEAMYSGVQRPKYYSNQYNNNGNLSLSEMEAMQLRGDPVLVVYHVILQYCRYLEYHFRYLG